MLHYIITLFSSDSRPQYTKDIFNVLALPQGGKYRFRYKEKYIHDDIIADLSTREIKGTKALIAFRTNLDVNEDTHFIVPVRWAIIESVQKTANFYLIDFIVKDFPVFNKEFDDNRRDYHGINVLARRYFATKDKIESFVVKNIPNIVAYNEANKINNDEDTNRWLNIIEALHKYPKFEKCYFFKASIIKRKFTRSRNDIVVREGRRASINIVHNNLCDITESQINIDYDENLLIPSGDKKRKVECSYDSVLFTFQAKRVLSKTSTQIMFNCKSSPEIETNIKIPLQIKRNYFLLFIHVILSLTGAVLIGLPGILPKTTSTNITIPMFIMGSFFIAFNWLIPYKE